LKRRLTIFLIIAVFVVIIGGVRYLWRAGSGTKKSYSFDLIVKSTNMDYWKTVNEGALAAASAYNATVKYKGPPTEENCRQQISILKESVAERPDAVILAASDYNLLAEPVQDAIDAGIPVLMIDSNVKNTNTIGYVGTDNIKLGNMLAQQLCEHIGKTSGTVGITSFVKESWPAVRREAGFRSGMELHPEFKMLETVYGGSDIEKTEYLTSRMVLANPGLSAVAALNAQSATGAARALNKLGRDDIQLYAIDCTPEEAMYMEKGIIKIALLQNPYQMGYYSVETACNYLRGKKVSGRNTDIYTVNVNTLFDDKYEQLIFPFKS